jgi:hypothetical protein
MRSALAISKVWPLAPKRHSIIRPGASALRTAHTRVAPPAQPKPSDLIDLRLVDRRLAYKNMRTALIAGAISLIVFALAWVVGLIY